MGEMTGYRELLESCAIVPTPRQSLYFLSGEDALEWLNGQVTQEVLSLRTGEARSSCLCSVTGQIEALLKIARLPDRIALQTAADTAPKLLERVETSVFMEDVQLVRAGDSLRPISVRGPKSNEIVPQLSISSDEILIEQSPHGFVYWGNADSAACKGIRNNILVASEEAWEAYRIEIGEPAWGKDIDSKTLPPELGERFLEQLVSYRKGCYIGQEVLMRIHARGHPNRAWVGITLEEEVMVDSRVSTEAREKAGVITSAAVSPEYGPIAAAMLHRDGAIAGTIVAIYTQDGKVKGKVRELPFRALE